MPVFLAGAGPFHNRVRPGAALLEKIFRALEAPV